MEGVEKLCDKIIADKETYREFARQFSLLNILFTTLLHFIDDDEKEISKLDISSSLDIVESFLRDRDKNMYYRFLNVFRNKQIHFIAYDDLQEALGYIFDYIYRIVNRLDNKDVDNLKINSVMDIIYDNLMDSCMADYLLLIDEDMSSIVYNMLNTNDYNALKEWYIKKIIRNNYASFVMNSNAYIIYHNDIRDAFNILHEFIHIDNISLGNMIDGPLERNFFLNEIPSIMMEGELYHYVRENYMYDLSFYLSYRLLLYKDIMENFYMPIINMSRDDKCLFSSDYVYLAEDAFSKSSNNSLMCMLTMDSENSNNVFLSYILGFVMAMYVMTLDRERRNEIFTYIRSRINSLDNYFTMFKNIGLNLENVEELSALVMNIYREYNNNIQDGKERKKVKKP